MILINLLPHREARRALRRRNFFIGLGAAAAAGLACVGIWYTVVEQMTSAQRERNAFLTAEIKRLEAQIKDIADLKTEIESLKARQKAVEDLQTDRNTPVYLLNELVRQTPEGVYLTSVKQNGRVVAIVGTAQTNERVADFLRNTLYSSPWLERPELVEIKAQQSRQGGPRLYDFSMRVSIKPPQAPAAASAPASGAAAAKKNV